jgi:ATP dependent DNA ligase
MKKISLVVLAVCSLLLVACKKPVEQQENFKVKYELKLPIDGTMKVVKEGDSFMASKPISNASEEATLLGYHGKFAASEEINLVVEVERNIESGSEDQLCIGICPFSNKQKHQKFEFKNIKESDADFKCTPAGNGDNIVTYTFYPKDEPKNKLTFKINFKK